MLIKLIDILIFVTIANLQFAINVRNSAMFRSNVLSATKITILGKVLFSVSLLISFILANDLYSQDYGGFTDPKTPGRHSRLNIDSANIVVIPHGIYAEVTTEFWYRSVDLKSSTDTLELYAVFSLPPADFMNDSWLWVEDTLVQAMIIDVNTATLIYEEIVHRLHKDPSILYRRNTNGLYEYRIYPNVGNKSRHAKISFYTKMNYLNGYAQFTYMPTILALSTNKSIPRNYKFYLDSNFNDNDVSSLGVEVNYSSDDNGKFVEFNTIQPISKQTFSYQYDFSTPYFSISDRIDDQQYYFTMFDSKSLTSNYVNQKINFLIDYDINRTTIPRKDVIDQLKKVILSNLNDGDSINIMIGDKSTINVFDRWVPCHTDSINSLIDSNFYTKIGFYSYLADLMFDGVSFSTKFNNTSSIILLTSSEYAPTPTTANPIIQKCLQLMEPNIYKVTTIDFSDIHYSHYDINNEDYYGNQYFNEKIAELTRSDFYSIKVTSSTVFSMLNAAFTNLKGTISDIGIYVEPADGITIAETSENLIDQNSNTKLIYEYGKIEGGYPIDIKLSALLDGKPVIQKYQIDFQSVVKDDESAKMWNWKYLRVLEDKKNKTKKESLDLTTRSISNRILTTQTAFLCLEPWMMHRDTAEGGTATAVIEEMPAAGLEINYGPNPIESSLEISIKVTNESTVISSIAIFDVLGNLVREFSFDCYARSLALNWDACNENFSRVPAGIYYLVIKTNSGSKILKLVVV
jgi:hypothetical protein